MLWLPKVVFVWDLSFLEVNSADIEQIISPQAKAINFLYVPRPILSQLQHVGCLRYLWQQKKRTSFYVFE